MTDLERPQSTGFNHHSPEFAADPYPIYQELRRQCPVAWTDAYGDGFWVVTRYDDIAKVARDDETFCSKGGITLPDSPSGTKQIPIMYDPPEFFPYRRMLNPLFSPAAVEREVDEIRRLTNELLDVFCERGEVEFIHQLASPLPARTTLRVLGIDEGEWERYLHPFHTSVYLAGIMTPEQREGLVAEYGWVRSEIRRHIEDRENDPGNDWISYLRTAKAGDRPLTPDEIVETVLLMLAGGLDTTTSAIATSLTYLSDHPGQRQQLIERPELIPSACEEFLRYRAPVQGLARTCTRDVELAGQQMKQGDRVLMMWASGNHDEDEFDAPGLVDFERHPNRHLTFGVGIHRCIGSNFARTQMRVAIEEVLRRIPDFVVDTDRITRAQDIGTVFGYLSMPASFTPAARES